MYRTSNTFILACLGLFTYASCWFRRVGTNDDIDDDELSEAETQSIPTMVRDWLTMTFTRSLTNLRLRQDRLRFRSVANAIRAGIVVDRSPTRGFIACKLKPGFHYPSSRAEFTACQRGLSLIHI